MYGQRKILSLKNPTEPRSSSQIDEVDEANEDCGSLFFTCGESFLVRGFIRGGKSGVPSQNQEIPSKLQSKNPIASFFCPSCGNSLWLGHAAKGFEDTFYFVDLGENTAAFNTNITKVIIPPPAGTSFVREGQHGSFHKSILPASHLDLPDPMDKIIELDRKCEAGEISNYELETKDHHFEAQFEKYREYNERKFKYWETRYQQQWDECNRHLPKKSHFGAFTPAPQYPNNYDASAEDWI